MYKLLLLRAKILNIKMLINKFSFRTIYFCPLHSPKLENYHTNYLNLIIKILTLKWRKYILCVVCVMLFKLNCYFTNLEKADDKIYFIIRLDR